MSAGNVLAQVVATVELRSAVTPPVRVDVAKLGAGGGGGPGLLLQLLKPTLVVSGPLGTFIEAPGGAAGEGGALVGALVVAAVLSVAFAVGVAVGRS